MTDNVVKKPVKITETVIRDAHQSLIATRMTLDEMLPILKTMDEVGYYSVEAWGGATFDSCLRFLDEDPWERLRVIRREMPNTKLQMLFRGQNMLGYRHYADDVVEYFVQKSVANGIDILRIFDALNDPRNLKAAIDAAKKEKAHVQVAMSYTTGPVFDLDYYVNYAKTIRDMGADSICIKDMAALITPYMAYDLTKALKEAVPELPVQLHTHYTSGLACMALMKAVEAGVDVIDTAMSPLALGTSHAPTESMVAALQGTPYDTGLDLKKLNEVRDFFNTLRQKYLASGQLDPKVMGVDVNALLYQVPGGMLSNLLGQLKQAGKEELFDEVLAEVPRVREDAGFPPLVTPSSQIVGTQAVFNVLTGERYKTVTKEFKGVVKGEYGQTPVPIDPEFRKKIIGDEEPILCRPADLLPPEMDKLREEASKWAQSEEDVLSYAQFGQVAVKFFENRRKKQAGVDADHLDATNKVHPA
ncbi:MAG: oxaloacetate decarboxylase subunit alpha [Oscillospiraceae bacterium]|nr:oxaloacetate decarboxylase subunit alpha [Oscillospiraceae bacterium]